MPPVNQDLADYAVTARLRLLRLETATVRDMLGAYDRALGNVTRELDAIADDDRGLGSAAQPRACAAHQATGESSMAGCGLPAKSCAGGLVPS